MTRIKRKRIQYPRKCEYCDYMSNNPTMYHYHKKTHEPIPKNQKCDHGCNQVAKYRGTGGVYTCTKNAHHCPEYLRRHSDRVKNDWENAEKRRHDTRKRFIKNVHSEKIRKKALDAIKSRAIIKADDAKDYRSYARKCRRIAQKWAKQNNYSIGQQTNHVDHKLSLVDAYNAKLDVSVASHPANLQVITATENTKKSAKSIITVDELLESIIIYEENNNV